MVMPAFYPDDFEVQIWDKSDDARLVAVVELVSPRNKDRPEARRAFAAKCAAYLQRGIGVMAADTVTTRQANMHDELVRLLELEDSFKMPLEASMAAVAYRPARRGDANEIDVWAVALTVGGSLPVLPLAPPPRPHSARPGGDLYGNAAAGSPIMNCVATLASRGEQLAHSHRFPIRERQDSRGGCGISPP